MSTSVVTIPLDMTVADIAQVLIDNHISGVPVVDPDGRPVGIVSQGGSAATGRAARRDATVMVAASDVQPGTGCQGFRQTARPHGGGYHVAGYLSASPNIHQP